MLKYSSYQSIHMNRPTDVNRVSFLRSKLFQVLAVITIALSLTSFGFMSAFATSSNEDEQNANIPLQIVVDSGDTLWSIAKEHKPKQMDTRDYIEMIKKWNGKRDSSIQTGEVLQIPILTD
ncbi:LysM peptidoglycan-binding domain-containing protein [Neobacillus drentensis]|uniref:LysM peptidoglycan-binding domain-containing protein n=1 Tax=Neobacillus drentensis TaxID=220684 RepID=UPI0030031770